MITRVHIPMRGGANGNPIPWGNNITPTQILKFLFFPSLYIIIIIMKNLLMIIFIIVIIIINYYYYYQNN